MDFIDALHNAFQGVTITNVRALTQQEKDEFYWDSGEDGIVFELDNDTKIIPLADPEGNRPGWIHVEGI